MKKIIFFLIIVFSTNIVKAATLPTHSGEYYRHINNNYTKQKSISNSTYKQNYHQRTNKAPVSEQISDKFISGYRLGFDIMGGRISNPATIKYGIIDFYTQEKTSEYSFDGTIGGLGLNFGLQHYQKFETELFADIYTGGAKSAPAYYNYISYPMRVNGYIMTYGVNEHYYYPFFENFKLDLAIGLGGIISAGTYTDKYDIDAYRQDPWSDSKFMYDVIVGFVYYPWDSIPLRFGYQRVNFDSDYIGKGLNKFYFGISYIFSSTPSSNKN